jgi:alkylated DNA repair dioxygenase AlkB
MPRAAAQSTLFDTSKSLPNGLVYRPDFITQAEEELLLAHIENLPLSHSRLGEYVAKRRIVGFGWGYDFDKKRLVPGPALPRFLQPLQRKIGKWLDIAPRRVAEALITEYTPGSPIGWHRDNESFEHIVGVSLAGWCRMRFRPIDKIGNAKSVISIDLEPRSAYIMQGDVRWRWQHSIPAVKTLRYSITFRTLPARIRL